MNAYLGREDAPIGARLWEVLDSTMLGVARSELTGRKLLDIDGPYGHGMKDISLPDEEVGDGVFLSASMPLVLIQQPFTLYSRDLAAFEREPSSLDLTPLVNATLAVARSEDDAVFQGSSRAPGILAARGALRAALSDWSAVGAAQNDLIAAVNALDKAGFHGPYAAALGPQRYNLLMRRFETAAVSELDVAKDMATAGVVKAPALGDSGVILQAGKEFAHIVIGQDMSIGFTGPAPGRLEFYVAESLAIRVLVPAAVCVLGAVKK
jgi:uncharacterized linocin/CFP29 family protein